MGGMKLCPIVFLRSTMGTSPSDGATKSRICKILQEGLRHTKGSTIYCQGVLSYGLQESSHRSTFSYRRENYSATRLHVRLLAIRRADQQGDKVFRVPPIGENWDKSPRRIHPKDRGRRRRRYGQWVRSRIADQSRDRRIKVWWTIPCETTTSYQKPQPPTRFSLIQKTIIEDASSIHTDKDNRRKASEEDKQLLEKKDFSE